MASETFIPADSFQGSKEGYYFSNGEQGKGYYLDVKNPKKRPRGVQFAEETVTRLIIEPETLLQQAEERTADVQTMDLTPQGVRSALSSLQKSLDRNQMKRAQRSDDPSHFMESEVALYEHISTLKAIAADPVRLYGHVELDTIWALLVHENIDIVVAVVSVLLEWMEVDLVNSEGEVVEGMAKLASRIAKDGADYLVGNLGRLESATESDAVGKGPDDILSLFDTLLEMDIECQTTTGNGLSIAASLTNDGNLLGWLFSKMDSASIGQRALEVLTSLLSREEVHAKYPNMAKLKPYESTVAEDDSNPNSKPIDGIEALLQIIGPFRKRQPTTVEEQEQLENACIILQSCLTFSRCNVQAFLDGQGIELVIRCLKEKVYAGGVCLKLLYFSGNHADYKKACETLVEKGFLRYALPLWMGKYVPNNTNGLSKSKKPSRSWTSNIKTACGNILYALAKHLDDSSPQDAKARFLTKFTQAECCKYLVNLCLKYDEKARLAEYDFYREVEDDDMDEEEATLGALEAKLSAGGDQLHKVVTIAAFCCIGSKKCHEHILNSLEESKASVTLISKNLAEFISVLDESHHRDMLKQWVDQI